MKCNLNRGLNPTQEVSTANIWGNQLLVEDSKYKPVKSLLHVVNKQGGDESYGIEAKQLRGEVQKTELVQAWKAILINNIARGRDG